jgi:hypothetical protein
MLEHVHDERPADALTVKMAAVDAQTVEQRDVVAGVRVPAVLGVDRGARLAAGVALIHRNDAESVGELGRRIDRRGGLAPHRDRRLQAGRRKGQDREPMAELFIIDACTMMLETRHIGVLS